MPLPLGAKLGPYEILAPLSAGGMGEVYRARDHRLGRDVAVKVLSEHLAADAAALARFEREAKALAALAHPSIVAIHAFAIENGRAYVAMELLEGESLAQRLRRGALAPRKAVELAAQIARGLAAAHDRGVIHRDLKPANVFLTREGVKILDFGLARQVRSLEGSTVSSASTLTGEPRAALLGTVGYMAPEQVRGQPADARADVFALGVVLCEMLSGVRAFAKASAVETMNATLAEDPAGLDSLRPKLSPALESVLLHCLEKEPRGRFQSAWDLAFALEREATSSGRSGEASRFGARPIRRGGLIGAAAVLLAVGGGVGWLASLRVRPGPGALPARIRPLTFSGFDSEPSASPDGRLVAFTSRRDGRSRVWIRQIGGGEAPVTAGEDRYPRFSPDGSSLLFLRAEGEHRSVYRQLLVGGEPRRIVADALEADWSPDGRRIAIVRSRNEGSRRLTLLLTADSQNGAETPMGQVEGRELVGVRWSPDGRTIAATESPAFGQSGRYLLALWPAAGGEPRRIALPGRVGLQSSPAWSGGGSELIIATCESLVGDNSGTVGVVSRFEPGTGSLSPLFWAPDLFQFQGTGNDWARLDALERGSLVFSATSARQGLVELTIAGPDAGRLRVLTKGASDDRQPIYTPDGRHVAFSSNRSGNLDIWSLSLEDGSVQQLTEDPREDWDPAVSRDGRHLLWGSSRDGRLQIWMAQADGSLARRVTNDRVGAENPTATPGLEWVAYTSNDPSSQGIFRVRADGTQPSPVVRGTYTNAEVSPDGRFVSFVETEDFGRRSYVRVAVFGTGARVPFEIRIQHPSLASALVFLGRHRWMPDGQAIAFVDLDERGRSGVWLQQFRPDRDTASTRKRLAGFFPQYATESFGISPDGTRIVLSTLELAENLMLAEDVPGVEPPRRSRP